MDYPFKIANFVKRTKTGRPVTWYVDHQIEQGMWREEVVPADVVGLNRPINILRASRKTNLITYAWHGDKNTFCPPLWWDLAIGSGACGLGCRACFLMLTHRIKRDPFRHLLYHNLDDYVFAVEKWLKDPKRKHQHTMGVGIDRSDSLLYEGVANHVRNLAPLFGNPLVNKKNNKLVLLTKSKNTHYLADIPSKDRMNIIVTFSLNPEPIADLWEGKWPDTGDRITPSISDRLNAAKLAQELGYEVRVRIDPILTPDRWLDYYEEFLKNVYTLGINFKYWTLGTYREKNSQLDAWRERWGLLPMEWQPSENELSKDGTHRHLPDDTRNSIYSEVSNRIKKQFPDARISLCKETHNVRKSVMLCNANCNCLV